MRKTIAKFKDKAGLHNLFVLFQGKIPQSQNPWKDIHAITQGLQKISVFLYTWLFLNASIGIGAAIYWGELPFYWTIITVGLTLWTLFVFFKYRYVGQKLYYRFSLEVSERAAADRSIRIPRDKQLLLQSYLRNSDIRLLKSALVVSGVAFVLVYAPKEVINLRRPYETLAQRLEKSIAQKQLFLQELQNANKRTQKSAQQLKRTVKYYQDLSYSLDKTFRKNYQDLSLAKRNHHFYSQLLQKPPTPEELEKQANLKDAKAEIEGALRLDLYLQGQNEDQAVAFLKNPAKIQYGLTLLVRRYENIMRTINNASYRDQLQMQMAIALMKKNQEALEKLEVSLQIDQETIAILENSLEKDQRFLASIQQKSVFSFTRR